MWHGSGADSVAQLADPELGDARRTRGSVASYAGRHRIIRQTFRGRIRDRIIIDRLLVARVRHVTACPVVAPNAAERRAAFPRVGVEMDSGVSG